MVSACRYCWYGGSDGEYASCRVDWDLLEYANEVKQAIVREECDRARRLQAAHNKRKAEHPDLCRRCNIAFRGGGVCHSAEDCMMTIERVKEKEKEAREWDPVYHDDDL